MKNIINYIVLSLTLVTVFSCNNRESEVYNSSEYDATRGGYVKFTTKPSATIDGSNTANAKFSAEVSDPNSNADYYETTTVSGTIGGASFTTDKVKIKLTSFPSVLTVTLADIAKALELPVSNFTYGDQINVEGKVVTKSGITYPTITNINGTNYSNLSSDVMNSANSYYPATKFSFLIACPSVDLDAMVGTYSVKCDWWPYNDDYQVQVKKLNSKQIVISPLNEAGKDIIVDVDLSTSSATVAKQIEGESIAPYGAVSVQSGKPGLIFTCSGKLILYLNYTVAAGSFGTFKYELTRV